MYVAEHFREDTEYLRPLFKDLIAPVIPKPVKPKSDKVKNEVIATGDKKVLHVTDLRSDDEKEVGNFIFTEQVKNWVKATKRLDGTIRALYEIVWVQCSRLTQAGVHGMPSFDMVEEASDLVSLLQKIRHISNQTEADMYVYGAYMEAMKNFFTFRQPHNMCITMYMKHFKYYMDCAGHVSDGLFESSGPILHEMVEDKKDDFEDNSYTQEEYKERVRDKLMVTALMGKSNKRMYGPLVTDLRGQFLFKNNVYPDNLMDAYSLLKNHSSSRHRNIKGISNTHTPSSDTDSNAIHGMQYAQDSSSAVPGNNGRVFPNATCTNCGHMGHGSSYCPHTTTQEGSQLFMDGAQLANQDSSDDEELFTTSNILVTYQYFAKHLHHDRYKDTAILIDTGSTCSVFHNKNMLSNVRKSRNKLHGYTNGGHQDSTLVGDLPGFFQVWYNPSSMLNILAWCDVTGKYRITADTAIADAIHVHVSDDTILTFKQVSSGLFLLEDNTINDLVS